MVLLLSVAFTIVGAAYLLRLPDGRACPTCGTVPLRRTAPGVATPRAPRFLGGWIERAYCRGCGWNGHVWRGPLYSEARRRGRRGK